MVKQFNLNFALDIISDRKNEFETWNFMLKKCFILIAFSSSRFYKLNLNAHLSRFNITLEAKISECDLY